ncbi:MAG: enoyl-CoA hydratase/isomerase family protein, partial [Terriglobales bacterium]
MIPDTDSILSEQRGVVGVVTMNRPDKLNALGWDHICEIASVLDGHAANDEIRAVVLTGAGRAFSAGGDVKGQAERATWPIAQKPVRAVQLLGAVRSIWELPKPVVAAVNGVAAAAGLGLALLCDLRIVDRGARLGFPFAKVGLGPDLGVSWTLPRIVGPSQAARLLFSAAFIDADEAARIGLADEVVDEGTAVSRAITQCEEFAALAPLGLHLAKAGLRRSAEMDFANALEAEMMGQHIAAASADHEEGRTAFSEKRPPHFTGA